MTGAAAGAHVGSTVGASVMTNVGALVGVRVVGEAVGRRVLGANVTVSVGKRVDVGANDGRAVEGAAVGSIVG